MESNVRLAQLSSLAALLLDLWALLMDCNYYTMTDTAKEDWIGGRAMFNNTCNEAMPPRANDGHTVTIAIESSRVSRRDRVARENRENEQNLTTHNTTHRRGEKIREH